MKYRSRPRSTFLGLLLCIGASAQESTTSIAGIVPKACAILDENFIGFAGSDVAPCSKEERAGSAPYKSLEEVDAAITRILRQLPDPNMRRLTPSVLASLMGELSSNITTTGIIDFCIHADLKTGDLILIEPLPGSSAWRQGLRPLDRLWSVNGRPVSEIGREKLLAELRGSPGGPGGKVQISVKRQTRIMPFTLTREPLSVESVSSFLREEDGHRIGFLSVRFFAPDTAKQAADQIRRLLGQGAEAWVLDLRNNPGGLLASSRAIAGMFLNDAVIHRSESRTGTKEERTGHERLTDLPMAVLVNEATASATEMLAAALRDNGRAKLVGTHTFGQGTIYFASPLPDRSMLLVAGGHILTPKGLRIEGQGLEPDVSVAVPDLPFYSPADVARNNDPQYAEAVKLLVR